ncbi:MAG: transcriptional regulator, AraC family [Eubacterium sp.]|nr:transcriptional regulator, AraC family [Eubacterium sp.]
MDYSNHEKHIYIEQDFPIIFHYDTVNLNHLNRASFHWHESIELLYFIEGRGRILCGLNTIEAEQGDIVTVNCNELHHIEAVSEQAGYYCLIVNANVYENFGFNINTATFSNLIKNDHNACSLFKVIIEELNSKKLGYRSVVSANILNLIVHLTRYYSADNFSLNELTKRDKKINTIKKALDYIRNNYSQNISVDDICLHVGFSKFYFCRLFKAVTRKTVIEYLNIFRCQKAKSLLSSGKYNVIESAELCGYNNISYFCRVYKKYFGYSPSRSIP